MTDATEKTGSEAQPEAAEEKPQASLGQFSTQTTDRARPEDPDDETPLLRCESFSVFYDDFHAIKDVTADLARNQVTAIIGPSGCGKSTFLNAINRMTDLIQGCHTEGTLLLDGDDVYGREMDVVWLRRRIGMVFQKPNPFPKSIFDNVAYGPRLHGTRSGGELDDIVEESLRGAALWDEVKDRLKSNAMSLSGGQQQRLCIARALAIEPEVILLDEPTSALDPGATAQIENLLETLRGQYSIVIVTHNMQQAARVSDYTMFFYKGDLIEFNKTVDLFENPEQERTENYITGRFG